MELPAGTTANAQVIVTAVPGAMSVAAIDIVAGRGSTAKLSILVDSPEAGTGSQPGVTGTTVRIFADADARVAIGRTQTLEDGFTDIDDMGLFAHDRARIEVRQTVLGAGEAFTGLAGDLRGDSAHIGVQTHYLGHGTQSRDFNYALRHHGARTRCKLQANGVLAGESRKVLRGTIDLVRGCKGAEGSENETVLLVDEGVRNKTVPVILCNEDDVAGNHGATIGHIRQEQLFYLASRGLSPAAAESLFALAMVEQAALDASNDAERAAVTRLGERLSPGFANLFDASEEEIEND
jgi:Fe-S cluster assembly scaffold protein SufB